MATTTAQVSGTTAPDNWVLAAGASKVVAVNQPDDDATSYVVSTTTTGTVQWFTCSPALAGGDVVTEVIVRGRVKRGGSYDCNFTLGYQFALNGGGTQSGSSAAGSLVAIAGYNNFAYTHSGLSAAFGSGLVLWIRNDQAREIDLTTLYADITYTPVEGQPAAIRGRFVPGMGRAHGQQGW